MAAVGKLFKFAVVMCNLVLSLVVNYVLLNHKGMIRIKRWVCLKGGDWNTAQVILNDVYNHCVRKSLEKSHKNCLSVHIASHVGEM